MTPISGPHGYTLRKGVTGTEFQLKRAASNPHYGGTIPGLRRIEGMKPACGVPPFGPLEALAFGVRMNLNEMEYPYNASEPFRFVVIADDKWSSLTRSWFMEVRRGQIIDGFITRTGRVWFSRDGRIYDMWGGAYRPLGPLEQLAEAADD